MKATGGRESGSKGRRRVGEREVLRALSQPQPPHASKRPYGPLLIPPQGFPSPANTGSHGTERAGWVSPGRSPMPMSRSLMPERRGTESSTLMRGRQEPMPPHVKSELLSSVGEKTAIWKNAEPMRLYVQST